MHSTVQQKQLQPVYYIHQVTAPGIADLVALVNQHRGREARFAVHIAACIVDV